jgi:CopG antitoxin of type II toxin-antitoxin system
MPEFQSEDEERKFWSGHDSTEFIDWRTANRQEFPQLMPTLRIISLRLPVSMIEDLKTCRTRVMCPISLSSTFFRRKG